MRTPNTSGRRSLLGVLAATVTVVAALNSLGGEWSAPPELPLAATPRGTVPLPPGITPVAPSAVAATATPVGIAPVATASPPAISSTGEAGQTRPTEVVSSPAAVSPAGTATALAGGVVTVSPASPTALVAAPGVAGSDEKGRSSGFPVMVASATVVTIGQSGTGRLEGSGGTVVITAGPGWTPRSRLGYQMDALSEDARAAAINGGLLVTNLVFSVIGLPPEESPQAGFASMTGLPLEIQVRYLNAQVSGIDRHSLRLYRYASDARTWQVLASCGALEEPSSVVCRADRPGLFLLAGAQPAPPPMAATGSGWEDWWWVGIISIGVGAVGLGQWLRLRRAQHEGEP